VKEQQFAIVSNTLVAKDLYRLVLLGNTDDIIAPGQFVNIRVPGFFLRRPFSICCFDDTTLTIVYKIVGEGTVALAALPQGSVLNVLTGLGSGYQTSISGQTPLLVGGGVSVPPLYGLCESLVKQGKHPVVLLGFNTQRDIFLVKEFQALDVSVHITTKDGSVGIKGIITDLVPDIENYSYYYACGPMTMLQTVYSIAKTAGQLSLESRMGCGFGACMGCSVNTKNGPKRICKDGPVLESGELLW